jgi:ankyrin repeat protein
VNFKGENDWTALHYACLSGNFRFVNQLILNDADVEAEGKDGVTPLMVACSGKEEKIV